MNIAMAFLAVPVGEVDDHRREEAAFGQSEQEADDIKLQRALNESRERRQQAPHNHDGCEPPACAPAFGQHSSWDLQEAVAEEEDACAEPEHLVGET